jgi:hypothetical protein
MSFKFAHISELVGQTLVSIKRTESEEIIFETDYSFYMLCHYQDCCESVCIESVVGDLQDLVGTPITLAEEVVGECVVNDWGGDQQYTFYKFATIKGYVDIRWNGESNGYYSVGVSFMKKSK